MKMLAAPLNEALEDAQLDWVRELLFVRESGAPIREAIAFGFSERTLIIKALSDTSELDVRFGELEADGPDYLIRDASQDEPFQCFIGKRLRDSWIARNDRGYFDAFLIAFEESRGLCFVAMNDAVSILSVAGEQWS